MKKLSSILLLLVFSFNLIGYKLLFGYLQLRSDQLIESQLDHNDYNESELFTIRIPLSMPYQIQNTDFERVDGEITVQGIIYKYVKRKIDKGELILQCVPDKRKMQLESGKEQLFHLSSEFEHLTPSKHFPVKTTSIFKLSIFDIYHLGIFLPEAKASRKVACMDRTTLVPTPFVEAMEPPPMKLRYFIFNFLNPFT